MYLFILIFPLLNFIILFFFGRFLGTLSIKIITMHNMMLTVLTAFFIFFEVSLNGSNCYLELFNWIFIEHFIVKFNFNFDAVNSVMFLIITIISTLVHLYSYNYMKEDPNFIKFISYLSLFTFFMLILVTANNLIQMFIGWEGVGIASFLLISFWNSRNQAIKSSLKAVILNRIGDISLLISISLIFLIFKTIDYDILFLIAPFFKNYTCSFFSFNLHVFDLINLFLVIGAIGKSAQIGLHIWLPDAMEGPTPVSALIHAATMVTAGIFLLIKFSFFLEYSQNILNLIAIIGGITVILAGTIGLVQYDIKKIIAYSTCSQLGYMFVACGLSTYNLSLFHLYNHAFFKALLFLSAGAIIHALNDEQDIRKMGGLSKILPFIYNVFIIGSFALMGFPFLTGYYSKDLILELCFSLFSSISLYIYILIILGAFLTSFYSLRLIFLVFFNKINSNKKTIEKLHEVDIVLGFPLFFLSFCSIFVGYIFKDFFIGLGNNNWNGILLFKYQNYNILNIEFFTPFILKYIPLCLIVLNFILIIIYYVLKKKEIITYIYLFQKEVLKKKIIKKFQTFFLKKWYFDYFSYNFFSKKIIEYGFTKTHILVEKNIIENFFIYTLTLNILHLSKKINKLQNIDNNINNILFLTIVFVFLFIITIITNTNLYIFIYLILFIKNDENRIRTYDV